MRTGPKPRPLFDRWQEKVLVSDDCWEWTGGTTAYGYGVINVGGRHGIQDGAHRVAYHLFVGPVPEGMFVCHHCDNPQCVKPSHLFLGTPGDNMRDRSAKGRSGCLRGERQRNAKLTERDVSRIKNLIVRGWRNKEIGLMYHIGPNSISNIRHGVTWGWLADAPTYCTMGPME